MKNSVRFWLAALLIAIKAYGFPANSFVDVAKKVLDGVVHVKVEIVQRQNYYDPYEDFFYGNGNKNIARKAMGFGSGVIVSKDGYIVTNNHVIEGAEKIEIILNNRMSYIARLIGNDPSTDLALLKIEATDLVALNLANSDQTQVGEAVLAVGNPLNLTSTVTAGIVSAKGRNINILKADAQRGVFPIESFIQTDAAVNQGNSGGALVNTQGEMIGVITAIASTTGAYSGYAFAVPSKIVKKITDDLLKYGKVQRAFLGLQIAGIDEQMQKKFQLKNKNGVFIAKVDPKSGAADAGVLNGDVILKIGDKDIKDLADLQEEISQYRPGDVVNIRLIRENKEINKTVKLKSLDGQTQLSLAKPNRSEKLDLGANIVEISQEEKERLKLNNGLKILDIQASGKIANAGIENNFIITKINNKAVQNVQDLYQAIQSSKADAILLQGIYPNGVTKYYALAVQ